MTRKSDTSFFALFSSLYGYNTIRVLFLRIKNRFPFQESGIFSSFLSQAIAIASYLSELMIFSIASTGFMPTHCMT